MVFLPAIIIIKQAAIHMAYIRSSIYQVSI